MSSAKVSRHPTEILVRNPVLIAQRGVGRHQGYEEHPSTRRWTPDTH